ncbi:MAG: glycoside hydrolase family 2 TIM barrel-domain containing protein, partial [Eubacteriales bacterium]
RVNGKDVKINGVMYYEFSAETGLAVSEEELLQDVLAMKALNINAVRSPGIPFSNTFLDLCDKYGLYVVSDINLESQPYANKDEASLPASQSIWQSTLIDRLLNVVDRDANRASVIMWAIGHESGTGSSFKDLRNYLINNLDDRLIIYDDDEAYSDIIVGVDWSFAELNEQIRNAGKKPILLEMSQISYLNSAGNLSTYMDIINSNDCLIGGFFGYWADKALYWPIE